MQVTFVAHVVNTGNAYDPGLLVVRVAGEGKPVWLRISPSKPFQVIKFPSVQAALDDMRSLSRCSAYAPITEMVNTNWTQALIEEVVESVLIEQPELLAA